MSSKRDFPSDIISHMEKTASRKVIDRKDKGKSVSIMKKTASRKVVGGKDKGKSVSTKRK